MMGLIRLCAKGYLTLKCAGKDDESKELLADLDANTWSLSLSR